MSNNSNSKKIITIIKKVFIQTIFTGYALINSDLNAVKSVHQTNLTQCNLVASFKPHLL